MLHIRFPAFDELSGKQHVFIGILRLILNQNMILWNPLLQGVLLHGFTLGNLLIAALAARHDAVSYTHLDVYKRQVYDPQYSLITAAQYNKAAESAKPTGNNAGIKKIDTAEIFGDHFVPGAPDTYPKELADIPNVADRSYNKGGKHAVTSGGSSISFDVDHEQTQEYKNGFNLDFSAELDLVASVTASAMMRVNAEGRIGLDFTAGGGASWINSTAHGKGVGATVNALPKASNAYAFNITPAMWRTTALEKDKDGKNPYVLGFLTEGAENADVYKRQGRHHYQYYRL